MAGCADRLLHGSKIFRYHDTAFLLVENLVILHGGSVKRYVIIYGEPVLRIWLDDRVFVIIIKNINLFEIRISFVYGYRLRSETLVC